MGMMPNDRTERLEKVLKRFGIPSEKTNDEIRAAEVARTEIAQRQLETLIKNAREKAGK